MKGFAWAWVIIGMITAAVISAILINVISSINYNNNINNARSEFENVFGSINSLCNAKAGEEDLLKVKLPTLVQAVYASESTTIPEELGDVGGGHYICLMINNKSSCKEVECELFMETIRTRETFKSLVNRILKKREVNEFPIHIRKNRCGVVVSTKEIETEGCVISKCGFDVVASCNAKVVVASISEKFLASGDSGIFFKPNSDDNLQFLVNVAEYLGGNRVGMIYEDECIVADPKSTVQNCEPKLEKYDGLRSELNQKGISIEFIRRKNSDDLSQISMYNQLWIVRPGWCLGTSKTGKRSDEPYCKGVEEWEAEDFEYVRGFIEGDGAVFITSDFSEYDEIRTPQTAPNGILGLVDENVFFYKTGCYCGCGDSVASVRLEKHPIAEGIGKLDVKAATYLTCD